jgi:hypothetical protein
MPPGVIIDVEHRKGGEQTAATGGFFPYPDVDAADLTR